MKDVRFYEEFISKRRGLSAGNVVAVFPPSRAGTFDGVAALYDNPNSAVASTGIDSGFLFKNCKRVSEARARQVHPELFKYLDAN